MKFTNIPAGDYSVVAYGKTSDGKVAAKGTASVTIKSGQTTTTTIHLTRIEHFTVSFKDGATLISSQEVSQGYTVSKPADPIKEGNTFSLWKKDGVGYDFNTPITADTELIAAWNVLKYTITFDYNGGSSGGAYSSNVELEYGTTPNPATPTRSDSQGTHTFLGWATSQYATSGTTDLPSVTGNTVYYAIWKPKYKVTFNYNGGSVISTGNSSDDYWINSGDTPSAPSSSLFQRPGYEFKGWAETATATTTLSSLPSITSTKVFYAIWEAVDITITYTLPSGLSVSIPNSFKTYKTNVGKTLPVASDMTGIPSDVTFDGWYFNSSYSGTKQTDIAVGQTLGKTYYGKFTTTVTINKDNGTANSTSTVPYGTKLTEPAQPTKTGYKFLGWFKDSETTAYNFNANVTASFTLKAHWGTYTDFDGTATEFANAIFDDTSSATSPYNVNITDVTSLSSIATAISTKQIYVNLTLTMATSSTTTNFFFGWSHSLDEYLISIVIPDGFTEINYQCFQPLTGSSRNLKSVTIPDSVTKINAQAFYGTNLTTLAVTGTWTWFDGSPGGLPDDGNVLTPANIVSLTAGSGSQLTRE